MTRSSVRSQSELTRFGAYVFSPKRMQAIRLRFVLACTLQNDCLRRTMW